MSLIVLLVPFIIVSLIVILIIGLKTKTEEEGEGLMKNVYVYLVLFATLMMSIGGSVGVFMALADVVSPAPYYQSFEEYRQWGSEYDGEKKVQTKSEEELRASYDAMIVSDQEQSVKRSLNTLIKSFGWIVIPLPIFIYFQRRLARKEQQ